MAAMTTMNPLIAPPAEKHYDTWHSAQADLTTATPMMAQFLAIKQQYPGVLLLYRMGDFYETFFEDALITARALDITLTSREGGKLGKVPMAGVPVKAAEAYLGRLLAQNHRVAICEQMEDPALAKGLVERQVVRVLSPGTLTESSQLRAEEPNYLAAIHSLKGPSKEKLAESEEKALWALAFTDLSTGVFQTTLLSWPQLLAELERLRPTELLVPSRLQKGLGGLGVVERVPTVPVEITQTYACTPLEETHWQPKQTQPALCQLLGVNSLHGFGLEDGPDWEIVGLKQVCGAVASYLRHSFVQAVPQMHGLKRYWLGNRLKLTASARRNLELTHTLRDGKKEGSLLSVLNRTQTAMGSRLLQEWLSAPLYDLAAINERHNGVEVLALAEPSVRNELADCLNGLYDLERLATRLQNLTAGPRELLALGHSLNRLPKILSLLDELALTAKTSSFYLNLSPLFGQALGQLASHLTAVLQPNPPISAKEGNVFLPGYHAQLDEFRALIENQTQWQQAYEAQERSTTGIKTLKVAYTAASGYYIEISKAQAKAVAEVLPDYYRRKQTLTNAERFITPELKAHEEAVYQAQNGLLALELSLFNQLRQQVQPLAPAITGLAQALAALDVLLSLATVAVERHYCRPQMEEGTGILALTDARHPVVEARLPMGAFVANHCQLQAQTVAQTGIETGQKTAAQVQIITGPNMAGKSTYMRQVALAVVMAQMGSFVAATHARLSLIDALFTRIGAVDDLGLGQSTFMVEMQEVAQILNEATPHSLVILDEVGRGTSTYDGVAIAWSVVSHLVGQTGARTLFATHYHELNVLALEYPQQVQNVRVCVSELPKNSTTEGELVFLHRVEPGAAQKSYGLQVARLAGVPGSVLQEADRRLARLQKQAETQVQARRASLVGLEPDAPQLRLFE